MKRLMAGIVGIVLITAVASAQAPFADVPQDHWAYDSVNTLAERGLVNGYPDGMYGGKRAMTRYEFAVVIARMIPTLEEYIRTEMRTATPPTTTPEVKTTPPTDTSNLVTKGDLAAVRKLVDEFRPEISMLRVDVDGLKKDLAALEGRVSVLEDEVNRVKITGDVSIIARATKLDRDSRENEVSPVDIDGRGFNPTSSMIDPAEIYYDMDLNIKGRVSEHATANATLTIGNYLAANSHPYRDDWAGYPYGGAGRGSHAAEVGVYKAYIATPLPLGPLGMAKVEVGKTGVQFTPYTLKLVDYDTYTNIAKTDNGDIVMTGIKGSMKLGPFGVMAYAGTHATPIGASGYPVYFTTNFTPRPWNMLYSQSMALFPHIEPALQEVDQSAGVHLTTKLPLNINLGLTMVEAGIQPYWNSEYMGKEIKRGEVYGANMSMPLFGKLGLAAEFASSRMTDDDEMFSTPVAPRKLNNAYDGKLTFDAGKLALCAGYKQIDPFFGAPGSWGKIGSWKNPTNIRGFTGAVNYGIGNRLKLNGSYSEYDSVIRGYDSYDYEGDIVASSDSSCNYLETSRDTGITHYTAGLTFGLTKATSLDLGLETVEYERKGYDSKPKENYYTVGLGSQMGKNSSVRVLYQIVDYKDHFFTDGYDAKGNLAVAQFQVKF